MDHRRAMRAHLEAFERAIAATPAEPWTGFLAQHAVLSDAYTWLRGLDTHPDPKLEGQFEMTVLALRLALEDVLRLFPADPVDHPAPRHYGELTGQLLPEIRDLLKATPPPIH